MRAIILGICVGLLGGGAECAAQGKLDSTGRRDTQQIVSGRAHESSADGSARTTTAEPRNEILPLTFPDGSVREVAYVEFASLMERRPLTRPVILRALLLPLSSPSTQHKAHGGVSRMLPTGPLRTTSLDRLAMEAQRYKEYLANPALPPRASQIDLLGPAIWLISLLW